MSRPKRIETLNFDSGAEIKRQLQAAIRGERNDNPIGFADFCESTLSFSLHQWQRDYLCPLLERFRTEKGLRIILHAPSQLGKCNWAYTLISTSSGECKFIKDIVPGDVVLTLDEDTYNIVPQKVKAVLCNGVKPLRKLTFASGRILKLTDDHPLKTADGWILAKDCVQNTPIIAPKKLFSGTEKLPKGLAALMGYLVGNGSLTSSIPGCTLFDPALVEHFTQCAEKLGFKVTQDKDKKRGFYRLCKKDKSESLPFDILDQYMARSKSIKKKVPDCIWTACDEDVADFLGAYFNCDAHVGKPGKWGSCLIEYYSASPHLLPQVSDLLKRFGIYSALRLKHTIWKGEPYPNWRLSISGQDIIEFAVHIPVYGIKGEQLKEACININNARFRQADYDAIPDEWRNHLKHKIDWYDWNHNLSCTKNKLKLGMARWKVLKYAAIDDSDEIRKYCNPDIIYDRVVSNEEAEPDEVYDLEIENNHNFVANGLVVHNSILVSQRLPAWLMGCDPKIRIGLASYNQDHAIDFGKVIVGLMQDESYEKNFPNSGCRLNLQGSAQPSAALFSTHARAAARDGQYSFVALGLNSGFTGKGVDFLIIDDPYKSGEDARSEAVNSRTWRWWDETAGPRTSSDSNVLVVYHRYSMDDLGARLMAQSDEWVNVRFAMVADDNPLGDDPTVAPSPNPMRVKGELLSPLRNQEWVDAQLRQSPQVFYSQSQGTPLLGDATVFDVTKLQKIPYSELPTTLTVCRSYDFAASDGKGDYTVGVLIGIDFSKNNTVYILDMWRNRKATSARDAAIKVTAERDGYDTPIVIPTDPGAAGKSVTVYLTQELIGYIVKEESVSGDKVTKATPFAGQVNIGNVFLVDAPWNKEFQDELRSFPIGKHDDVVDAVAQGFNHLIKHPRGEVATTSLKTYAHVENESVIGQNVKIMTYEDGTTAVINRNMGRFVTNRRF